MSAPSRILRSGAGPLSLGGRPWLMGVVNASPDSFSDGGVHLQPVAAVAAGWRMLDEGAAIVDVGGESTRPGADPVDADEQLRRVLPVIEGLAVARPQAELSIDTSIAVVAAEAIRRGATIVNDVTALRGDPKMAEVIAEAGVGCCLMHMLGEPRTMQLDPHYEDVVGEVKAFLVQRTAFAVSAGMMHSYPVFFVAFLAEHSSGWEDEETWFSRDGRLQLGFTHQGAGSVGPDRCTDDRHRRRRRANVRQSGGGLAGGAVRRSFAAGGHRQRQRSQPGRSRRGLSGRKSASQGVAQGQNRGADAPCPFPGVAGDRDIPDGAHPSS